MYPAPVKGSTRGHKVRKPWLGCDTNNQPLKLTKVQINYILTVLQQVWTLLTPKPEILGRQAPTTQESMKVIGAAEALIMDYQRKRLLYPSLTEPHGSTPLMTVVNKFPEC